MGGPVADKRAFIKDYKFVISFENSTHPGYTTEKLIEPMLVNSIPVYWGNTEVGKDFNTDSFVHVNQYASYEKAIERIIELDKDEEQYLQMAAQPWFNNSRVPGELSNESLETFFDFIVSDMKTRAPVATSFLKVNAHKAVLLTNKVQDALYARLGIHKGFR
ncbi:MAG: glycosyltransferase family 10 [Lacibacter sp.]